MLNRKDLELKLKRKQRESAKRKRKRLLNLKECSNKQSMRLKQGVSLWCRLKKARS